MLLRMIGILLKMPIILSTLRIRLLLMRSDSWVANRHHVYAMDGQRTAAFQTELNPTYKPMDRFQNGLEGK